MAISEYNSPAYTIVVLEECERILQLARDPAARDAADALRRIAWRTIGTHSHSGSHSRNYLQWLDESTADYLSRQTGVPITPHPRANKGGHFELIEALPCPEEFVPLFRQPRETELRQRFVLREKAEDSIWGTTWMDGEACLGSVNRDTDARSAASAAWILANAAGSRGAVAAAVLEERA